MVDVGTRIAINSHKSTLYQHCLDCCDAHCTSEMGHSATWQRLRATSALPPQSRRCGCAKSLCIPLRELSKKVVGLIMSAYRANINLPNIKDQGVIDSLSRSLHYFMVWCVVGLIVFLYYTAYRIDLARKVGGAWMDGFTSIGRPLSIYSTSASRTQQSGLDQ